MKTSPASPAPAEPSAPASARQVSWGLGDAAGGWLVAQACALVASVALLSANGSLGGIGQAALDLVGAVSGQRFEAATTPLWMIAILQAFLWIGLLGAPLLATRTKGNGLVEDLGLRFRWIDVPVGAVVGIASQFLLVPAVSIPWLKLLGRDLDELEEPARELADKATDPFGVVLLVLIVVIGAPIIEELFFRGLLQRAAARRWGSVAAVALASVVFGLTHFQLLQLPALVAFGAVLGFMAVRTGRLGPGIFAHLSFNAVTVIALLARA